MWWNAIGGMVQGTTGLVQSGIGLFNRRKAKKAYEGLTPLDYRNSEAYKQAETNANLAGRYAQEGLPEETMRFREDMVNRSVGSALGAQSSLRSLGNVGSVANSLSDQYRSIAEMDANARIQQRGSYLNQLGLLKQEQAKAFDTDMGYDMLNRSRLLGEMAAGRQMFNQGLQNFYDSSSTFQEGTGGFGMFGGGGEGQSNSAPTTGEIDSWGGARGGYSA